MKRTFLGLRTVIYNVPDIDRAKAWYMQVLGLKPYFDEPFYVGFNVGGFELGLVPLEGKVSEPGGVTAY
ncbi:MAG TPA: VOC family protein, partial [Chryseosolibacter sp.]